MHSQRSLIGAVVPPVLIESDLEFLRKKFISNKSFIDDEILYSTLCDSVNDLACDVTIRVAALLDVKCGIL